MPIEYSFTQTLTRISILVARTKSAEGKRVQRIMQRMDSICMHSPHSTRALASGKEAQAST